MRTSLSSTSITKDIIMIYMAVIFFIVAIIAAVFGFGGLANDSAHIAKILAFIGIILAVISFLFSRRTRRL